MDLSEISDNQNRHPWELSRTRCILRVLRDIGIKGNILDIGCGDSYFDKRLAEKFLDVEVYGVDIFLEKEMHEGRVHAVNSLERLPIDKATFFEGSNFIVEKNNLIDIYALTPVISRWAGS